MSSLRAQTEPCRTKLDEEASGGDCCAIIAAGGSGKRFGHAGGKQLLEVCGLPLMCWSLLAFEEAESVCRMVVVCAEDYLDDVKRAVDGLGLATPIAYALAGAERQDSCRSGLAAVRDDIPFVALHDGARPLVRSETVDRAVAALRSRPDLAGVVCGQPAVDTLKLVEDELVVATPDRSIYWNVQTPQVFRLADVRRAHELARRDAYVGTDDASLVERAGGRVGCVDSPRDNLKLTVPEDLPIIEAILSARIVDAACGSESGR